MVKENQQQSKDQEEDSKRNKFLRNFTQFLVTNLISLSIFVLILSIISWVMYQLFKIKMNLVTNLILIMVIAFFMSPQLSKLDWGYRLADKYIAFLDRLKHRNE